MNDRKKAPGFNAAQLDRTPPNSPEAEKAVLGSVILDPSKIGDMAAVLKDPECFYAHAHQVLFRHLTSMSDAGAQIDVALIVERLRQHGDLEAVGGMLYLGELAQSVPTAANAVYYANIVRDYSLRRVAIHEATEILRDAYDDSFGGERLVESVHERAEALCGKAATTSVLTASQAVDKARERLRSLLERKAGPAIDTGLTEVDRSIGGMFPGELVIAAGRTSVGKTVLALMIAMRHALRGMRVLFFSSEMGADELALRHMCASARVSASWIRNHSITDRELSLVDAAGDELEQSSLLIDEREAPSAADIRHTASRLHRQSPLTLVVVDHLQRLRAADEKRPRHEQVAKLVSDAKNLARELRIPVLLLSQVNRDSDKASDHRPRLSNLSQSGNIETDADQVWILHRPELYSKDPDLRGVAELHVAKNRNGPTGEFRLAWDGSLATFRDAPSHGEAGVTDEFDRAEEFLNS